MKNLSQKLVLVSFLASVSLPAVAAVTTGQKDCGCSKAPQMSTAVSKSVVGAESSTSGKVSSNAAGKAYGLQ